MIKPKGFALVLVLWVLSLLTIMAGSFALTMRREAAIVSGSSNNAQATAVAESGLAVAELMMLNPDPQQRWRSDSSIYQIDYADVKVRVQLLAETGKIDLNGADQALLQGLMASAPVNDELQTKLVDAILDWRDADDLVRMAGAEKDDYKDAGLNYRPRNKPFQSIEELQWLLGMNEQVFNYLENKVTVYSGQANVDTAQASKQVLQVLPGMDAGLIDDYIAARRESAVNGLPAPAFSGATGGAAQIMSGQPGVVDNVQGAGLNNGALTVIAEALLADGTTSVIKVLLKKSASANAGASPFQVLKWQRSASAEDSLFTDELDPLLVRQYAEPEFDN